VDYYRDYGETLEATFFHDLTKDYEYQEVLCDHTTYLEANTNLNSIQLQWSNPAENVRGYHLYRNNERITSQLLTDTIYLDENLPNGNYEYYVKTYYKTGCVSDSSNHIIEAIDVGIVETDNYSSLRIYPNPTRGEIIVECRDALHCVCTMANIEIFDVMGKNLMSLTSSMSQEITLDLSHLPNSVYILLIRTENNVITKKIVKK
jgi:hypothetical protein